MVGVADAGEAVAEEGAGARALDAVQHAAAGGGHGHLLPALAAVAQAAVPQLGEGRLVALVVVRLGALQELLGQEAAGHQRRGDTSLEKLILHRLLSGFMKYTHLRTWWRRT